MIRLVMNPKNQEVEFYADENRSVKGKYFCNDINWAAYHIIDALNKTGEHSVIFQLTKTVNHEPYIKKMVNRIKRIIKEIERIQKTNYQFNDGSELNWDYEDTYHKIYLVKVS